MGGNQDLLSVTAFFSALFHAIVILGISFKLPDIADTQNADNTLDVVLINAPNNEAPDKADVVSTNDSLGGGSNDKEASSPLPYEPVNPMPIDSIKLSANQQPVSSVSPDQMITSLSSDIKLRRKDPKETLLEAKKQTRGPDRISTKSQRQLERERLIAKINQTQEEYNKRPNKKYFSPTAKQHEAAAYLDKWRKKVEVVGNANYPAQARAKSLSGTLILTVEVNRNGTINSIIVNNPSPHKLLNDSAVRFVRNASPFDSVPDGVEKGVDILVITRAFHFLRNNRLSSSAASSVN